MGSSDIGNGGGSTAAGNGSTFPGQTYCLRWNNHKSNLVEILEALIKMECYVDCTIYLENQVQFKAHRVVLAANSPYFQAILQDVPMDHCSILFPGVHEFEMRALLEYMYTGEVNVTKSQIPKIMKIAELLEVKGLYDITDLKSRFDVSPQPQADLQSPPHTFSRADLRREKEFEREFERDRDKERSRDREYPFHPNQLVQSSPTITTSAKISSAQSSSSPPYGYRAPYPGSYTRSPIRDASSTGSNMDRQSSIPAQWSLAPPTSQNNIRSAASMLSSVYESGADMNPLKRKKLSSITSMMIGSDTPILRNVLAQTNSADSSQSTLPLLINPSSLANSSLNNSNNNNNNNNNNNSSSNNSNNNNSSGSSTFGGRKSDRSHHSSNGSDHSDKKYNDEPQSPFTDKSFEEDSIIERKASPQNFSGDSHLSAFLQQNLHYQQQQQMQQNSGGSSSQKPEWKRYKQYTRNDILSAIECVRNGMSALQASRKFGVPSRTLYDKVKKLGITTGTPRNRTIKRESGSSSIGCSSSNAPFPYGLSGANFGLFNPENQPPSNNPEDRPDIEHPPIHHPIFDPAFLQQALDFAAVAAANGINANPAGNHGTSLRPSSPNVLIKYIHQQRESNQNGEETPIKCEPREDSDMDEPIESGVEDLSMTKKTFSRSPSPAPAQEFLPSPVHVITESRVSTPSSQPKQQQQQQGVIVVPPIKYISPRSEPSSTSPSAKNSNTNSSLVPATVGSDDA